MTETMIDKVLIVDDLGGQTIAQQFRNVEGKNTTKNPRRSPKWMALRTRAHLLSDPDLREQGNRFSGSTLEKSRDQLQPPDQLYPFQFGKELHRCLLRILGLSLIEEGVHATLLTHGQIVLKNCPPSSAGIFHR